MTPCPKCKKPCTPDNFPVNRYGHPRKRCNKCFSNDQEYYKRNKVKIRKRAKEYYQTPQAQELWAKSNKARMERAYGLFPGQKEILIQAQDSRCAICKKVSEILCVDHDHNTGKIRAMLCRPCNLGLGNFRENLDSLQTAIDYLKYWNNWK